ncbi:MobF family relaxase [Ornithinimicrobium murale]|uniref:MobF family relaxase n=1 Tax=Ornithinimicrobium murale TaxID=1050153 RepID=UPI000E0DAE32|nr:MobF family relaxase [Ornithinimicrobium murale]
MTIHKLTAGSGYDYLTRQVARQDATETGHAGLTSYYTAKGESPGVWVGSGMVGIEGLAAGDEVTAEQMARLFGTGEHPLGEQVGGPLGARFRVYTGRDDLSPFRIQVARRFEKHNRSLGLPADHPIEVQERARIRTEVAAAMFVTEHRRAPLSERELAGFIARQSRPKTTAVAGYDLTFSPVKSVSTLWAVADLSTAAQIERAHQNAVREALSFLEQHALFTRTGKNGVQQVDVRGLVATAFTHRDSRAGDPDLHTHVAVANKVQTLDGNWLSIDGRLLFKATVTASETYNTALEKQLRPLGIAFEERQGTDTQKRSVREVVGVDPALNERWSSRRASIEARRSILAQEFQGRHGRPPTPIESIQLAQQATLETREAKHEPRSLAQQRATWHAEAVQVLGGPEAIRAMVNQARRGAVTEGRGQAVTDAWVRETARRIVSTVESSRSTWQVWHVRAEAQRRVRRMDVSHEQVETLVDRLSTQALRLSQQLQERKDPLVEPAPLRRSDGSSVYQVAGSDLFTSHTVVAAEQRLVATAGRTDARRASPEAVEVALLESVANGVTLNAGQAELVREMATSGARLQLAIAPAGAGKTTAMRSLTKAWEESGGTVLGLAPSAAAAAALRDQAQTHTDTLAKLVWTLQRDQDGLPQWAHSIGPDTLVLIDEAGMADTLSLDTAVDFITTRGGAVRLIGDDQQLAAIGAGGVLRDIRATHGALHLTELMRFEGIAEGAASLALRDGKPEALGFYLDAQRVHVGDMATMTEEVFQSWQADRGQGRDAIMLAPTRELVAELNQKARAHRMEGTNDPCPARILSDGNEASVGDVIITRTNDRRLTMTATDFVKNGDRWTIVDLPADGSLQVQHTRAGRTVNLPPAYVQDSTELGYATTVHAAQGVSVDTTHALATGAESRQQLYTMMTRGAHANHLYLEVVGDGDEHNLVKPGTVHPRTATDLLEQILARDESPVSATTMRRTLSDPAHLLGQSTDRYLDALYMAAADRLGQEGLTRLDEAADAMVPDLTKAAAWPTLRAHLTLLAAHDIDPAAALGAAVASRELDSASDPAAVLGWRLDDSGLRNAGAGPLPWVPAVPQPLAEHPTWGDYLTRRAGLVTNLASEVTDQAVSSALPDWATQGHARPSDEVLGKVAVWRAAMSVDPADLRPTGPPQMDKAPTLYQRELTQQLAGHRTPALDEWGDLIGRISPQARADQFAPVLAERLAAVSRAGLNAAGLVSSAAHTGPLPDDHAASALWWRVAEHLSPAVTAQVDEPHPLTTTWVPVLGDQLGTSRVQAMQDSPWWPVLVTSVDHALQRGWDLSDLATTAPEPGTDVDDAQAMVWRITMLTEPPTSHEPDPQTAPPEDDLPGDLDAPSNVASDAEWAAYLVSLSDGPVPAEVTDTSPAPLDEGEVERGLVLAALVRETMDPLELSDAELGQIFEREAAARESAVPLERLAHVNAMALAFYEGRFATGGWARDYLTDRFGQDVAGHAHVRPGYAPAGWTHLVDHLRARGVTTLELTESGLASTTRDGRLIDRFRDRALFPIQDSRGQVLGFIGRRNPAHTDDTPHAGPKYLNTPGTPLFAKCDQLYGLVPDLLAAGATPVLVEGPMDAHAVTLAGAGKYVGVAPLGTALTQTQARQLATFSDTPLVATDADLAGRLAAERDHWLLSQHNLTPRVPTLPAGSDPADLLEYRGPERLREAMGNTKPLTQILIDKCLTNLTADQALPAAATVLATHSPTEWESGIDTIAKSLGITQDESRRALLRAVQSWHEDPRRVVTAQLEGVSSLKERLERQDEARPTAGVDTPAATSRRPQHYKKATSGDDSRTKQPSSEPQTPETRWAPLATQIDTRLPLQTDWPALARVMQQLHQEGHDVAALLWESVAQEPLTDRPAHDLRSRLMTVLPDDHGSVSTPTTEVPLGRQYERKNSTTTTNQRRDHTGPSR